MDLGRSALKLLVAKIGNSFLYFGGITYFTRTLAPDRVSVFFLYLAMLGVLSIPADLGMRGALEKRLSEGGRPARTLGSALGFKIATLMLVCGGVILARPFVESALSMPYGGLLVVGLITQELALFYVAVVRGELRVGETAPIEFTRRLLWVTVAVTLLHSGWGVDGILVGHICGRAVEFLWAYHRSETPIGRPSLDRIRSLVAFSKYQSVMALGGRAYQWMDVLIIGFFLSGRFVSAYEVAWQVTLLVLLLSKSIERSLFPQISQWDADAARARIESTVSRALGSVLFVSIPALVGAVLYAEVVLSTFFGPEYVIASTVLVILMAEKLCQSYNDIVGMSIRALDRPDLTARATALSVGLNLLLSPLLVVTIGFEGAAIATTVSWLVHAVLQTRYMARFVSFSYPVRLVCWYGVASVGMAGVLVVLRSVVPADGIVTLLFQVTVGICVYLLFSAAIPAVREQVLWPGLAVVRG